MSKPRKRAQPYRRMLNKTVGDFAKPLERAEEPRGYPPGRPDTTVHAVGTGIEHKKVEVGPL